MNVQKLVYDALQDGQVQREVFLEDLIRVGCGYRHYLHLTDAKRRKEEKPQDILLQAIALKMRLMISKYFAGCYAKRFVQGTYAVSGGLTVLIDGTLDDMLVDIQVVSPGEYTNTRAPRRAALSAATKAYMDGYSKALLVVINRNNQEWMFWKVEGDLDAATADIRQDMKYVSGLLSGDSVPAGMASETTCRHCPYLNACHMDPLGDPAAYKVDGLRITPALLERTQVESYLWSLNDKPNNRTKKVFHPSSFSTSKCDRKEAYDVIGVDQKESIDPRLRVIFDTGHCCHDVVQAVLAEAVDGFQAEVRVVDEKHRISGSCDGKLTDEDGVEIKSISSKGFAGLKKAKTDHEKQATIYGAILKLLRIHYIYINKETGDLAVYMVPINRGLWHKQAARASNILRTVEMDDMPPRIDKDYICRKCKYAWTCRADLSDTNQQQRRTFE